jgi:large subunit ribosomal protein L9
MAKVLELLLVESVEGLGIVGDVVKVRPGYARNFLMPRELATQPSEEKIKELSAKRAEAERQVAEQRKAREELVAKLEGIEITLERSCNDQGLLYGSVTQQDIATALKAMGYIVRARDVRLSQTIKRIDSYEVTIRPETDLEASVKLWVVADRELNLGRDREEKEFDNEGNLIEKRPGAGEGEAPEGRKGKGKKDDEAPAEAEEKPAKKARKS